jgi:hypothetical protein
MSNIEKPRIIKTEISKGLYGITVFGEPSNGNIDPKELKRMILGRKHKPFIKSK